MAAYGEIAAHSADNMFCKYKCLIVNLVFSHFGFWSGNFFLIAPFPDHCLLVPFHPKYFIVVRLCKTCFNLIMVDNYDPFFNCSPVGRASDPMMAPTYDVHFSWLG